MKWSWKIARIAGIDVYLHSTFLVLLAWFGYYSWRTYGTLSSAVEGIIYVIALFSCVVLHEFGHALVARRYQVVTRSITLLPIGGVASMDKIPENPWQEIKIALAGPAVNVFIAALLWAWLTINHSPIGDEELLQTGDSLAYRLMLVNIFLVIFNLLPAFPTDGGRVLRATLALFMKHHKATAMAARIGQQFALLFGLLGLAYNPLLILIAVFLWFGAEMENSSEQIRVTLRGVSAKDAMMTEFHVLSPDEPLSKAVDLTLATNQRDFPVGNSQQILHLLTHKQLLSALQQRGEEVLIGDLDLPNINTIGPNTSLNLVSDQLQAEPSSMLAVSDGNSIVGIVTLENLLELVQIKTLLAEQVETRH